MSQYNTPASEAPPWWESTWALAKPEIVRPTLGMSFSGGERNQLFLNKAGKEFSILSGISGADDKDDPRGFAYLDFDRDGFVDLALGSRGRPSFKLFRNNVGRSGSTSNNIGLRFVGGNKSSSASTEFSARDGIGATVSLQLGDAKILRENRVGEGWRTQNSSTLLIGLGDVEVIDRLEVMWPSGKRQVLENVPADRLITLYENASESKDGSGHEMSPYRVQPDAAGKSLAAVDAEDPSAFPLEAKPEAEFTMFTSMATWCAACKRELTNLQRLRDNFGEGQLAMVGVPIDPEDSSAMLETYKQQSSPAYALMSKLDGPRREQFQEYVRRALHTDVLPATIILRRDGTPVYAEPGTPTLSKMSELLARGDALRRRETWASSTALEDDASGPSSKRTPFVIALSIGAALALGFGLTRRGNKGA